VHRTTGGKPRERFEAEKRALRALPQRPPPVRHHRMRRKVANDCFVDVETIRYSVPWRLARQNVEVTVLETEVRIFAGPEQVARHDRCFEPHTRVINPEHFAGLASLANRIPIPGPSVELSRGLNAYAEVVG